MAERVWLNTRLLPATRATVSVFDHSFLYGDGIYETFGVWNGRIMWTVDHLRRLQNSARAIALKLPWTHAFLTQALDRVVQANRIKEGALRLTVSRGNGPLGLNPRLCPAPTLVIQAHPSRNRRALQTRGFAVGVVSNQRASRDTLDPAIKANAALPLVLAKLAATQKGWDEAILLNAKGYLTEGTTTNLFWFEGGRLVTPALGCGLLPGIMRARIMKTARQKKTRVVEGFFRSSRLRQATEIFLTNSTLGVLPVRSLHLGGASHRLPVPGRQTALLLNALSS